MPTQNQKDKKDNMPRFNLNWLYIAVIVGLGFMLFMGNDNSGGISKEVSLTKWRVYVQEGYAKEVINKLPMEFAVEAQKLLSVSLEGSVG